MAQLTPDATHCLKCGSALERKTHKPGWTSKAGRHYFEWWLKCTNQACLTIWFVEKPKRGTGEPKAMLF